MIGKIPGRLTKATSLGADLSLLFNRNDMDDSDTMKIH